MYIEKIENLLTSLSVVRYKSYNSILFGGLFKSVNNKYILKISRHLPTIFILTIIYYSRIQDLLAANGSSFSFLIPENTVECQSTMYILL